MPKILELKDIGIKGINTDIPSWSLPVEYITDGINFSINTNTISSVSPYIKLSSPPIDVGAGHLLYIKNTNYANWLYAGTSIYATNGSLWTDVSSVGGYPLQDKSGWSGGMYGKLAVLNNSVYYPQYIDPTAVTPIMTDLQWDASNTWSAASKSCKMLRPYKNFLFALGMTESGVYSPDAYRWSHPADTNGLPFTWDETDLSGLAGRAQLGGDGGEIIDGLTLRDSFVIYSRYAIDVIDFTGDEFVFNRRNLTTSAGLVAKRAIVEVNGVHFFLSDGDIYSNDGNAINSIIYKRIKDRLVANMNIDNYYKSFAIKDDAAKAIGFVVPEGSSTVPNVAYVYNWKEDSWTIREITPTVHAAYGQILSPTQTWSNATGSWDFPSISWGSLEFTPLSNLVMAIDESNGDLLIPKISSTGNRSYIERLGFPLEGHNTVTTITRIYPHIKGPQELLITFGSQDFAGGSVRWQPAVSFKPGTDRKVDVRTTGELHCWRIEAEDSGKWEFSGMTIEYSVAGAR